MHLSTREHGAYLLLLMAYWKNRGPLDERTIPLICRMPLSDFAAIRSAIEPFFQITGNSWRNRRADAEIEKWALFKDEKEFGAAITNFKKRGIPIPERFAERYAERYGEPTLSGTPPPLPPPLPSSSSPPPRKENFGGEPPRPKRIQFEKPSLEELQSYCRERENKVNPIKFLAHYESNGWVVGKARAPMRNWKAAVVTWENNEGLR